MFEQGDRSRVPQDMVGKLEKRLNDLENATTMAALDRAPYRLHELKGERAGTWSIRVTGNWRVTFRTEAEPFAITDVDLEDYH